MLHFISNNNFFLSIKPSKLSVQMFYQILCYNLNNHFSINQACCLINKPKFNSSNYSNSSSNSNNSSSNNNNSNSKELYKKANSCKINSNKLIKMCSNLISNYMIKIKKSSNFKCFSKIKKHSMSKRLKWSLEKLITSLMITPDLKMTTNSC